MPRKGSWGGKRPGAGRKPRPKSPTAVVGTDLAAALAGEIPEDVDQLAASHAGAALAALVQQLLHGTSDSAKIDAAEAMLDRGYGKPTVEAGANPTLPFLGRAPVRGVANEVRDTARRYANLAVTVLRKIADNGSSEAARVRAARALLNRGLGAVTPAKLPAELAQVARPMGKKEEQSAAAREAARGRFAPPPAPRQIQ